MTETILIGLLVGALIGIAGLSVRVLQVAALAAVAAVAWVVLNGGPAALEPWVVHTWEEYVRPYARLLAGLAVGALFGTAALKVLRRAESSR